MRSKKHAILDVIWDWLFEEDVRFGSQTTTSWRIFGSRLATWIVALEEALRGVVAKQLIHQSVVRIVSGSIIPCMEEDQEDRNYE